MSFIEFSPGAEAAFAAGSGQQAETEPDLSSIPLRYIDHPYPGIDQANNPDTTPSHTPSEGVPRTALPAGAVIDLATGRIRN